MRYRIFTVVFCVLFSVPLLGQPRRAKTDTLSGTWTGEMGVDTRARPVTFVLKFDGTRNVTGTFTGLPKPGDVKSGTYDPKTGALKLELGIEGDRAVRLVLEGTVAGKKASGRVSGEATGEFSLQKKG